MAIYNCALHNSDEVLHIGMSSRHSSKVVEYRLDSDKLVWVGLHYSWSCTVTLILCTINACTRKSAASNGDVMQ